MARKSALGLWFRLISVIYEDESGKEKELVTVWRHADWSAEPKVMTPVAIESALHICTNLRQDSLNGKCVTLCFYSLFFPLFSSFFLFFPLFSSFFLFSLPYPSARCLVPLFTLFSPVAVVASLLPKIAAGFLTLVPGKLVNWTPMYWAASVIDRWSHLDVCHSEDRLLTFRC